MGGYVTLTLALSLEGEGIFAPADSAYKFYTYSMRSLALVNGVDFG